MNVRKWPEPPHVSLISSRSGEIAGSSAQAGGKVTPADGKFHYLWQGNFISVARISLIVSVDSTCRVTHKAK